jgi:hypothetical protein
MDHLPALFPNATPVASRFFAEMSKTRQRCAVLNLEMGFTIEDKASIIN